VENARNNFPFNIDIPPSIMNFKQRIDSRYGPGMSNQIKEVEHMSLELVRHSNHLTFLTKCKKENFISDLLVLCDFTSFRVCVIQCFAVDSLSQLGSLCVVGLCFGCGHLGTEAGASLRSVVSFLVMGLTSGGGRLQ